ncbi:MAG: hypothetical protein ACLQM8_15360 [Limisphaerales bacterium]
MKNLRSLRAISDIAVGAMVWLVLAPAKQVEVWRRGEDGPFAEPKTHGPGGPVTSEGVPGFTLDLGALLPA